MLIEIQHISFYPNMGGIETYLRFLCIKLLKSNHDVRVVCTVPFDDSTVALPSELQNIEIIRHPRLEIQKIFLPIKPIKNKNYLKNVLNDINPKPDIIISRDHNYTLASKELNRAPVLYIQSSMESKQYIKFPEIKGLKNLLFTYIWFFQKYYIERQAWQKSDFKIVFNNSMKYELGRYYRFNTDNIHVVIPGVDIELFKPTNKKTSDIFPHIQEDKKIIAAVGRLSKTKRFDYLIKIFSKLARDDVHLLIVGSGPEEENLKRLIRELNLDKKVTLPGYRNDIEQIYSISDIFIMTSQSETFGQVYLEALSSGLCCLGPKYIPGKILSAFEEIIQYNNDNGIAYDYYDENQIIDILHKLLDNDSERKNIGNNARDLIINNYTWQHHTKQILNIIL